MRYISYALALKLCVHVCVYNNLKTGLFLTQIYSMASEDLVIFFLVI